MHRRAPRSGRASPSGHLQPRSSLCRTGAMLTRVRRRPPPAPHARMHTRDIVCHVW